MTYYLIDYNTGELTVTDNLVGYNRNQQFLYIVVDGQEANLRYIWDAFYYYRLRSQSLDQLTALTEELGLYND